MIGNAVGLHPERAKVLIEESRCDDGLLQGWQIATVALHGVDETDGWDATESDHTVRHALLIKIIFDGFVHDGLQMMEFDQQTWHGIVGIMEQPDCDVELVLIVFEHDFEMEICLINVCKHHHELLFECVAHAPSDERGLGIHEVANDLVVIRHASDDVIHGEAIVVPSPDETLQESGAHVGLMVSMAVMRLRPDHVFDLTPQNVHVGHADAGAHKLHEETVGPMQVMGR